MKYPRISELGISVRPLRTRYYPVRSAVGSKCFAGQNAVVSNSDLGMDEYVPFSELNERVFELGIAEDFFQFLGGNSKINVVMYATDVEAALERCISGRVVNV